MQWWEITRSRYFRTIYNILDKIGMKYSRGMMYVRTIDSSVSDSEMPAKIAVDSIRLCTEDDLRYMATNYNPQSFRDHFDRHHNLIAIFHNGSIIGYHWVICFKEYYIPEIERSVYFDGAYYTGAYVDAKFRNQGLGNKLGHDTLKICYEELGARKVFAFADWDAIPSQKLLEINAFRPVKAYSCLKLFSFRIQKEQDLGEGRSPSPA
jgi:RimJ/RimL family protein N-acetyltransferase